jgi:hypothetical protein
MYKARNMPYSRESLYKYTYTVDQDIYRLLGDHTRSGDFEKGASIS